VVINEREGVIVIGEDVLISPVAINHKNLTIDARPGQGAFVAVDTETPQLPRPKLKNLVDALNALNVPTKDVIAIIRTLDRNGDLYGQVVFD
jgi:flagellar P-ring protein precursor FlgI